jgi:phage terminase large subunit-like protein
VPTWEAGRVYAIEGASFLPALLAELYAFPKATHDDQVDALVQGIRHLTDWRGGRGIFEYFRREAAKIGAAA